MGDVFDALVRAGEREAKPLPGVKQAALPTGTAASAAVEAPEPNTGGALPWSAAAEAIAKQGQPTNLGLSMPLTEDGLDALLDEPAAPPPIARPSKPPVIIPKELEVPRPPAAQRENAAAPPRVAAPARASAPPPPSAAELAKQQMLLQQYRSVRDALITRGVERGWKLHLFTCPTGRDGRAATVYNLGQAFTEKNDQRVLLVEAELRTPSFHRLFQKSFTPGLAQLLRGQLASMDAAIHKTKWDNLDVLPAGDCEFARNRELLSGQAMLSLLQEMKQRYTHVLIDAPPVTIEDGAADLASFADETLLVVKMRTTPTEQVDRAKRVLRAAGVAATGVIVSHG